MPRYWAPRPRRNNMVNLETGRRPHLPLPQFWSGQFGVNIKGVGVCSFGDEIVFTQGSVEDLRFAAAYGRRAASSQPSPSTTANGWSTTRQTDRAIGAVPAATAWL